MVEILKVESGSIAEKMGITAGDTLVDINGQEIKDYIDYQYLTADDNYCLKIKKQNGDLWQIDIEKSPDENLGIILDGIIYDQLKECHNNCIFCFIDQQPPGLRASLLKKDDDYRFSFLQGSYITLSNLNIDEFQRIIDMNLSPLNISVHTTNPELRVKMMNNPQTGNIKRQLKKLTDTGIKINTQLVLCPGYNDGKELDRTISELINFYPELISIGAVPVGLTGFRTGLTKLETYDEKGACKILKQIKNWQQKLVSKLGNNILYAADEFYLLAGEKIPDYGHYNGFPQLENGIGLTRLLRNNFNGVKHNLVESVNGRHIGLITAILGEKAISPIIDRLEQVDGITVDVIVVENKFFSGDVTVTGLLTGKDIIHKLKKLSNIPEILLFPSVVLNDNDLFLDDLSLQDIKNIFSEIKIIVIDNIAEIVEVINNV